MRDARPAMQEVGVRAQALKDWFVDAVDLDTAAFNAVIASRRLPNKTEDEKKIREEAIERANQAATRVPLSVLTKSVEALELAKEVALKGNPASVSDAGVGGACALAAAEGASLNVLINLPSLTDARAAAEILSEHRKLLDRARKLSNEVRETVDEVLSRPTN